MMGKLAAAVWCLLAATAAWGQQGDLLGRASLVVRGGGATYVGDINEQSLFGQVRPAAGVGVKVRLDNRWSVRLDGMYGTLSQTRDWQPERNLGFRTRLVEGSLAAEFNFRPYGGGSTDYQWTPYLFGGVALFHFNPKAQYADPHGDTSWVALQPLCTEGQGTTAYPDRLPYTLTHVSMPFGMGVKVRLGKTVEISAEYGLRRTWTDYLDDVSTTYVGSILLEAEVDDGRLAAQMADRGAAAHAAGIKRGDDSLDDWYTYFNVSVSVSMDALFGWMRSKRCRN